MVAIFGPMEPIYIIRREQDSINLISRPLLGIQKLGMGTQRLLDRGFGLMEKIFIGQNPHPNINLINQLPPGVQKLGMDSRIFIVQIHGQMVLTLIARLVQGNTN